MAAGRALAVLAGSTTAQASAKFRFYGFVPTSEKVQDKCRSDPPGPASDSSEFSKKVEGTMLSWSGLAAPIVLDGDVTLSTDTMT
ncbi:Sterol 3-beta-glucosyltransferase [Frankliniella fusca]|uniref:Sterol 3-beta-glucosyltransferase n=1 Tax=Frankliniella fusca TaxID=407009 RepID=A0AAE1H2U7_9NEOP|nr:Sterol 3-beta-glucosyltransferase [Frankliniella fusca]